MTTARCYKGNTAESRIGTGPAGFVVLECFYDFDRRIGKVDGTKLTIEAGFPSDSYAYTNEVEGGAVVVVSGRG